MRDGVDDTFGSKVPYQIYESIHNQQPRMRQIDLLVLELPGVVLRDEDSRHSELQGRINIGLRRVADHARLVGTSAEPSENVAVAGRIFLRHDLDLVEVMHEPGSIDLDLLLIAITFGADGQGVLTVEVRQRRLNMGNELYLVFEDPAANLDHNPDRRLVDLALRQPVEAILQ